MLGPLVEDPTSLVTIPVERTMVGEHEAVVCVRRSRLPLRLSPWHSRQFCTTARRRVIH